MRAIVSQFLSSGLACPRREGEGSNGSFLRGDHLAVVEDDEAAIEEFSDIDLLTGPGPPTGSWGELDPSPGKAHGVVLRHSPCVSTGEDVVDSLGRFPKAGQDLAWGDGESSIVICDELRKEDVRLGNVGDPGQSELGDEAILEGVPESFDPALSLGTLSRDEPDSEFGDGLSEHRRILLTSELFFQSPMGVVPDQRACPIAVELGGKSMQACHSFEQLQIPVQVFRRTEQQDQDFARGVIDPAHQAATGPIVSKPPVIASIDLNQASSSRKAGSPLSVLWGPMSMLRGQTLAAAELPDRLPPDLHTLDLSDLLRCVGVVEIRVLNTRQRSKTVSNRRIKPSRRWHSSESVDEPTHSSTLELRLQSPELPHAKSQSLRSFPVRDLSCQRRLDQARPWGLFLTHLECPHGRTLSCGS